MSELSICKKKNTWIPEQVNSSLNSPNNKEFPLQKLGIRKKIIPQCPLNPSPSEKNQDYFEEPFPGPSSTNRQTLQKYTVHYPGQEVVWIWEAVGCNFRAKMLQFQLKFDLYIFFLKDLPYWGIIFYSTSERQHFSFLKEVVSASLIQFSSLLEAVNPTSQS